MASGAMAKVAAAAYKLDKMDKMDKLSKDSGACCIDDTCMDDIPKEECSGIWSAGVSCSDSKVQCGVFRIAAVTGEELMTSAADSTAAVGSCCVDGQCTEVGESDCAGVWTSGAKCYDTDCSRTDDIPRGACCNPNSGACQDGIEETACAAPAKWTKDGKCQPNGVCTGACCDNGKCSQQLKKDCPGEWTLYKDCKLDTCPRPTGFVAVASVSN